MKPYISVILPCHNVADFLPMCMESLERQTIGIENLELIFVDDASTDDGRTWAQILAFEQKYPNNVAAIHLEENRCQGGARNVGLEYASADYIGYLDPDDWIDANMYLSLYMKALQYQCDVVDCRTVMAYPDGTMVVRTPVEDRYDEKESSIVEGGKHWMDCFLSSNYGGGIVTGIYRRELLLQSGVSFPEHMKYEDNYWQAVLLLYVKKYYHMGADMYFYRQNMQSTMHKRNQNYHFDRLEIERQKLQVYKELGVFERFQKEIERDFLVSYYVNTLLIFWSDFDVPPYKMFCRMQKEIKELFPEYKSNPYLVPDSMLGTLVELIGMSVTEDEFIAIGKNVMRYKQGV